MVCLIESKNKPLLDSYTDILGSKDAAYYVLSQNNGYSLEFTPNGERSDLFRQLLVKNNYDYEAAIQEKAEMYYSSFYDKIGGDWTMQVLDKSVVNEQGEPKIDYVPESIDFSDIFEQPVKLDQTDQMSLSEIEFNLIHDDMDSYVGDTSFMSDEQIHSKKTEWLANKQKKLVDSINTSLLSAFGLEKKVDKNGNVYFISKDKNKQGKYDIVIKFCEYLENGKRGVYDQTGRIESVANLIQISLTDADPTTINHELGHHYVRMFWNTELIQSLAEKLDTGDRSEGWQVRLEEKVVDAISRDDKQATGFWNKLKQLLKSAFAWVSDPVKQSLLRKASIAFRLNNQSLSLRREQRVLQFINPLVKMVFQNAANRFTYKFNNTLDNFGNNAAVGLFINDSIAFFESYTATPDSILKDEYDEYVDHFKHTFTGLNITEQQFNEILILFYDFSKNIQSSYTNPNSPQRICLDFLTGVFDEIRTIRKHIQQNNINAPSTNVNQGTQRNDAIIQVVSDIMASLKTRIYEYLHSVPNEAKKANEVQELIDRLNLISDYGDKLKLFVSEGVDELRRIYTHLNKLKSNNYADVTPQQLTALWNTVDGFYRPIINLILDQIAKDETTIIRNGFLYDIGVILRDMQFTCSVITSKLSEANKVVSRKEVNKHLVEENEDLLTDELKERLLENAEDQLIVGKLFEDINSIQPYIGLASRSRSLIVKVARNMILSANNEIRQATLKDTAHIVKLYIQALPEMRKLGLKKLHSVFQELDENGIPTGYFVRKLNYGRFYREMDEYRTSLVDEANKKLIDAFGEDAPQIIYDEDNNPILPLDDDITIKNILQEYSDKLDEWQCEYADRMFIPEYYRMRRKMLSPNTRLIMQNVQDRINIIMRKCPKIQTKNGKTLQATWELSPEDQQTLIQLNTQYQQLGNQYYSNGTKKGGEELKIAQEISRFREWKNSNVKYNQNEERFNAAIEEIRKTYGLNSLEEQRFRKLNSSIVVDSEYYEYVLSKISLLSDPRLDKLRKQRNDLKQLISEFDKRGIDIEQKRRQIMYWDELKEVDRQISELIYEISEQEEDPEKRWSTYFKKRLVMYDQNTTLIDHILAQDIREYRTTHPADTRSDEELRDDLIKKYQYVYTWQDKNGDTHETVSLVSVFHKYVPVGTDEDAGKFDAVWHIGDKRKVFRNALSVKYSQQFSDIDPESYFYNKNYDDTQSSFVQPRKDLYQNDNQWSLIENNENIHKLYDALIDLMHKNNSMIPNANPDSYKLPQITGRRLTMLSRCSSLKEIGDALNYIWYNEWHLNDRDDTDINYEDMRMRVRADGTLINTVPVRYLKMLDNKKAITSDVIGSVIAFTEMANNFVIKTRLSSELEVIKRQLLDREDAGLAEARGQMSTHNVVKQLTNMMDDQLYGNTTKLGQNKIRFENKQQVFIKFMRHFQRIGRKLMLGFNLTSMHVGFWESAIRGFIEAVLGKDYTLRDFISAWGRLRHLPSTARQMGGYKVTNIQIAKMQWFGISKRIKESYNGLERNRFIKLINQNMDGMFGFTLGDYMNSSFQLSMALSNVRFIEGDGIINTGFYTKLTLIRAYQKSGMKYKEAKHIAISRYNESSVSLDDAYELKDGLLQRKAEYEQYITKKIEDRVTGKCYQRLAEALGVTPQDDNPGYGLYVLLKPFGALRTYMITMFARNWNWAHDFQKRSLDPTTGKIIKEDDLLDGFLDLDAGNMNISVHQGLAGWIKMWIPKLPLIGQMFNTPTISDESRDLYNYAATKVLLEMLAVVTLVGISTLFKAMVKGADDDDWWCRFGYLTSVRLVNSFLSILDPTSLLEIVKNISTLISPLDDLMRSVSTLFDMLGLSGHSPFEEIKSGSYKGQTRLFRNLMRITPFGNLYEDISPSALKSRTNWYLQQDPLVWSSVGGVFDQLWGTDSEGIKTKRK